MSKPVRALLLSAYAAASHRRWASGLTATLPEIDWTVLELPPRHFRWRRRGNPLWWALRERELLRSDWDLVVATSMVDLSTLVGLVPELARARIAIYFHENQLAYPTRDGKLDVALGVTDLYAALAADVVLFNSQFNRDSMLDGVSSMLDMLPDFTPDEAVAEVRDRASVIPVGLEDVWFHPPSPGDGPLVLVWNHRWEYDKAPERFFAALRLVKQAGVQFRVHVCGQQFRQAPDVFALAQQEFADEILTYGYVEDVNRYREILRRSDVVVSTALHEFQGLAVLEAIASGCVAAVPDRLAYRDFVPERWRYPSHVDDPDADARALAEHLIDLSSEDRDAVIDVEDLRWSALADTYRAALLPT